MFDRYTEKARRTIFFARIEASELGSCLIEPEHILLALFHEDEALVRQFLASHAKCETVRRTIARRYKTERQTVTSADMPLSHESKRVLDYSAEESQRLQHKHIGTSHFLLGLLREENSFAAQLLCQQGLTLASAREQVRLLEVSVAQGEAIFIKGLDRWLAEYYARGGTTAVKRMRVGNRTAHVAIYADNEAEHGEDTEGAAPTQKLAKIQKTIDLLTELLQHAIANHEFDKARLYSEAQQIEWEKLQGLCEQFNLEEPPPRVPSLCIGIIGDDRFSDVLKLCDDYFFEGVVEIWLLEPASKRAYTVTRTEGLREFKAEVLEFASPPLEMNLKQIFE